MNKKIFYFIVGVIICTGFSACEKQDPKLKGTLSLNEIIEKISENKISMIEIYYLSYEIETFAPKSKDELINSAYDCKVSLSSDYVYFDEMKQFLTTISSKKINEEVEASRLACIFYEKESNRDLKLFFNYNLKSVEIDGSVYSVSEEMVNVILSVLPQKSFDYASHFYQTVLKKIEYEK